MALKDIPRPSRDIAVPLRRVLDPIIDAVQTRLVGQSGRTTEKAITRADLVQLGLATQAQVNALEDS